jgi:hypothetical protein
MGDSVKRAPEAALALAKVQAPALRVIAERLEHGDEAI